MSTSTLKTREVLPVGTWNLDPVHSQVAFAVQYHVGTFRGSFSPVDARLEVGEDGATRLTGSVPVTGVKVQDENLAGHLQSPDFFDAERTPDITFEATDISREGDDLEVTGELTIKGTTLPVHATGTVTPETEANGRPYFGVKLEATLDRTRYGLNWNNPLPSGEPALANEVTLSAELYWTKS